MALPVIFQTGLTLINVSLNFNKADNNPFIGRGLCCFLNNSMTLK